MRSIWSPHRDSGCVQVYKSLLSLRGEDWLWVDRPEAARWLVIDATRTVEPQWGHLLTDPQVRRFGIALAKSWADVPSPSWTFFKLPLSPRGLFPWINQALGLPPQAHVDKNLLADASPNQWAGQRLRLRRWPNLSVYPDPAMRLPELCRHMLLEDMPFETLQARFQDDATLLRLLDDASRHHILVSTGGASATPPAPAVQPAARSEGNLFQRFLNRFR